MPFSHWETWHWWDDDGHWDPYHWYADFVGPLGLEYTQKANAAHFAMATSLMHYWMQLNRFQYTLAGTRMHFDMSDRCHYEIKGNMQFDMRKNIIHYWMNDRLHYEVKDPCHYEIKGGALHYEFKQGDVVRFAVSDAEHIR